MFWMPQMAPYNWFFLYIMFYLIYMYMITYMYFISMNTIPLKKNIKNNNNFKWMW